MKIILLSLCLVFQAKLCLGLEVKNMNAQAINPSVSAENFVLTSIAPRIFSPEAGLSSINKTRFYFENPDNSEINVRVFDLAGVSVSGNLAREDENIIFWDGRDGDGSIVNSGIYVYRIEAGIKVLSGTIIVAR